MRKMIIILFMLGGFTCHAQPIYSPTITVNEPIDGTVYGKISCYYSVDNPSLLKYKTELNAGQKYLNVVSYVPSKVVGFDQLQTAPEFGVVNDSLLDHLVKNKKFNKYNSRRLKRIND